MKKRAICRIPNQTPTSTEQTDANGDSGSVIREDQRAVRRLVQPRHRASLQTRSRRQARALSLALCAGLVAVAGLVTPAAGEKMTIDVSPKVSFAPARIVVKATIERAHENRAIEIVAESLNYYRSSTLPLDGEHAARTTSVQFPSLPRGTYRVTARLLGAADALRAIVSNSVVVTAPEARVPNGFLIAGLR